MPSTQEECACNDKEIGVHDWPVSPDRGRIAAELTQMRFSLERLQLATKSYIDFFQQFQQFAKQRDKTAYFTKLILAQISLCLFLFSRFARNSFIRRLTGQNLNLINFFPRGHHGIKTYSSPGDPPRGICAHEWVARYARNSFIQRLTGQKRIFY